QREMEDRLARFGAEEREQYVRGPGGREIRRRRGLERREERREARELGWTCEPLGTRQPEGQVARRDQRDARHDQHVAHAARRTRGRRAARTAAPSTTTRRPFR